MLFIKCDYCENRDICKFAEAVVELQLYIDDWQNNYITNNIINININCKRFKEN